MINTMKALVYSDNKEVTYTDNPMPLVEHDEVLVKVHSAGICGSDMHAYLGHDERRVPPLVLGHEAVGTVHQGKHKGKRVAINPLMTCGVCTSCLAGTHNICEHREIIGMYKPGAFAEYITIPETNLVFLPDDMDFLTAVLAEPGATALHAICRAENTIARPISESKCLVIGGGSVGLLTALLLKDKGAKVMMYETNQIRIDTIKQHTSLDIVNPMDLTEHQKYDIVFDAVGGAITRKTSIEAIQPGGCIVHIGLLDNAGEFDIRTLTLQEISLIGCYTYTKLDFIKTIDKLYSGSCGTLHWVQTMPLSQGSKAFESLLNGTCAAPKLVLTIE